MSNYVFACLIVVPREKKSMPVRIGRKKKNKGVESIVKLPTSKQTKRERESTFYSLFCFKK